ncbi:Hypothetical protein NTJ_05185 [Nesidiocoris tenuis]|uniref:Uncharacterized protein n=1 Tax=Nesidiocoris tenuis TaxID=355587 RepID=A0ABN7AJD8_9HEMI|nr:Hypothetical protein NTJ_05185 [Nesidiocoris tenuis]
MPRESTIQSGIHRSSANTTKVDRPHAEFPAAIRANFYLLAFSRISFRTCMVLRIPTFSLESGDDRLGSFAGVIGRD